MFFGSKVEAMNIEVFPSKGKHKQVATGPLIRADLHWARFGRQMVTDTSHHHNTKC